jgi:hypothetical protein
MRYLQILHTAKYLATKNPIFWLFGLALYGGFNLYLINFFTLFKNEEWKAWPTSLDVILNGAGHGYIFLILAGAVLFTVLNIIKILFIVFAHNEMHKVKEHECDLCVRITSEVLPYTQWLKYVLIASSITVIITSSVTLTTGSIITMYAVDSAPVVIINLLFVALITCATGIWNLFTGYFIVIHGMNFARASKSALDILVLRMRNVLEFTVLLSILYTAAVLIGNTFIYVWQQGIGGIDTTMVRLIALVMFVLWFAGNNVFFNLAFLVFFDKLVKSVRSPKGVVNGQLQPNILH